jgi:hypothetical protein
VTKDTPPCLDAALAYLERGWVPVPLHPHTSKVKRPGKQPLVKEWNERLPDEEQVRDWWQRWPNANVGVAMGRISKGLVAVDVDGEAGWTKLLEIAGGPGNLTATCAWGTPNGGRQLLYQLAAGFELPITPIKADALHSEVRVVGEGGQSVMPPSVGLMRDRPGEVQAYWWIADSAPWDRDVAEAPKWLLELAWKDHGGLPGGGAHSAKGAAKERAPWSGSRPKAPQARMGGEDRARVYVRQCDPAISGQGGHDQLLKVADKVAVGFALTDEQATAVLWEEYNPLCRPPWTRQDLARKVAEARKTSFRSPGYMLNVPLRGEPVRAPGRARPRPEAPPVDEVVRDGVSIPLPSPVVPAAPAVKVPALKAETAAALLSRALPPVRWVIPGVLPEGACLFGGRPKGGKSFAMMQASLEIAEGSPVWGHYACERAGTLYLSLEDNERRLQARLGKMMGLGRPTNWHFLTEAPTLGEYLTLALDDWLDEHEDVRLVVVDTLTRVRDRSQQRGSNYEIDYDAVAAFQRLAARRRVCIVLVCHTRKPKEAPEDEDPFDTVSGTLGLLGACDTIWVLKRPMASADARLHCRGKDLAEDMTVQLSWGGPSSPLWSVSSGTVTPEQRKALDALGGGPMTAAQVGEALGKSADAARMLLGRMRAAGLVRTREGGWYPAFARSDDRNSSSEA